MSFLYEQMHDSNENDIIVENELRDDGGWIVNDGPAPAGKTNKVYSVLRISNIIILVTTIGNFL